MRILIVEDEMVSRVKMETLMRTFGECITTESGSQAICLFKEALNTEQPFQLITLDINMPDMQGTKVLEIIRKLEVQYGIQDNKRVRIMMVTAQMDRDKVLLCIEQGCDDYLAKPFNVQVIRKKLQRLCLDCPGAVAGTKKRREYRKLTADAILSNINTALRKGDITLPTLPQLSIEFRRLIQGNAGLDELCTLLKTDMSISSSLVRIANSAMYRGFEKVHAIEQAVHRLGLSATEQMVNAISNQRLYATETPKYRSLLDKLWKHALASAFCADSLRKSMWTKPLVDPFTAGLLHDIGALALIQVIAEMEKRGRFGQAIEMDVLFNTIIAYHAAFGAKLLKKWQFEFDYTQIALYHNSLHVAKPITEDLLVANLANLMAKSLGCTLFDHDPIGDLSQTPAAQQLNLNADQLQALQDEVRQRLAQAQEAISN